MNGHRNTMPTTGRRALLGATLAAPLLLPGAARAQAFPDRPFPDRPFPDRPVRIVVAFSPGGEPDILMRAMAPALQAALGQPVVIDNRPGATTIIAAEHVAQARPDGYTLLMTSSTTFAVTPHLFRRLPFRIEQFQPVTLLMRAQLALYANPRLGLRNVADVIARARTAQHPMKYATTNRGAVAHLSGERMKQVAGIALEDVTYRGSADAAQALIRGDVDIGFDGLATYLGLVRNGDIQALAVTGDRRIPALPNVPTFDEEGFPDMAQGYWYGLFAPAGIPEAVLARINDAVRQASAATALGEQMTTIGARLQQNSPAEFAAMIAQERDVWGQLIRRIGLTLD